jgi:hypothetical protein
MTRLPLPLLLVLSLLGAVAPAAHAQNAAQADALFKEGKRLMGAKQFGEACSAFEASYKLDPAITTLVNHADCREKNAQYASAWGLFLEVDRQTRGDKKHAALNRTARDRATALEPRLSYLIINVPDDSRVDGLSITQNGQPVDALTWNRALPVDGGEYVIEGKAPGHEPWQTRVTVAPELDKQSVDVPKFKSVPAPEPVAGNGGTGAGGGADADEEPVPVDAPTGMTGKRKAALGVGAAGVVGLIAAGVFELGARSKYDEAAATIDDELQDELYEQAQGKRSAAIVFGALGAASVGVATYLWLTGGRAATETDGQALRVVPAADARSLGVALTGSF